MILSDHEENNPSQVDGRKKRRTYLSNAFPGDWVLNAMLVVTVSVTVPPCPRRIEVIV